MLDVVFRVGKGPAQGDHTAVRVVEIEGEPWWLLKDLMMARGFGGSQVIEALVLARIPESDAERIWLLEPRSGSRPWAVWAVSAEGASVAHDVLAARPRKRRTGSTGGSAQAASGVQGLTAQRD